MGFSISAVKSTSAKSPSPGFHPILTRRTTWIKGKNLHEGTCDAIDIHNSGADRLANQGAEMHQIPKPITISLVDRIELTKAMQLHLVKSWITWHNFRTDTQQDASDAKEDLRLLQEMDIELAGHLEEPRCFEELVDFPPDYNEDNLLGDIDMDGNKIYRPCIPKDNDPVTTNCCTHPD